MTYYVAADGAVVDEEDEEGMAALGGGRGATALSVGGALGDRALPVDGTNVVGKVTVTLAAGGTAKVAGEFAKLDGAGKPVYDKKNMVQTVKASGSATVLPTVGDDGATQYVAFVYLASKGLNPHVRNLEFVWPEEGDR